MSTGHSTIKPYTVAELRLLFKRKKVTVCGNHTVGIPFSMTTAVSFKEWIITEMGYFGFIKNLQGNEWSLENN